MNNRFTVTIEFSYKGETFAFSADIDLDECMEQLNTIPDLHDLIARRNGIDAYSYQYEVLCFEDLQFSQVEGFAADFIHGSEFDVAGFPARWRSTVPDYGLDNETEFPRIAGDRNMSVDQAKQVIADSLKAIPTLSLVMNVNDMFGTNGIYRLCGLARSAHERRSDHL